MGKAPDIPDPKTPSGAVNVSPLQARVAATQPLPRQAFGSSQRESLGAAMAGAGIQSGQRYDPKMAMELLRRGSM